MQHARACTLLFAPYVNSYKRFRAGSFAPTAIAWAHDNRTAGFRIVGSRRVAARRVPHPRRRRQPLPRLRRHARRRPRRHRPAHRAAAALRRRRLRRRRRCRACRRRCPRRSPSSRRSPLFRDAFGAEVVEHLRPLRAHRAAQVRRDGDDVGAAALPGAGVRTSPAERHRGPRAPRAAEAAPSMSGASKLHPLPPRAAAADLDAGRHLLLRARRQRGAVVLDSDRLRRRRAPRRRRADRSCRRASPSPARCSTALDALIVSGGGDINPKAYGGRRARDGLLGVRGARRVRVRADPRRAGRHARADALHLPRPAGAERRLRRHAARPPARPLRRARRAPPAAARHQRARRAHRPRQPPGRASSAPPRPRCAPGIIRRSTRSATACARSPGPRTASSKPSSTSSTRGASACSGIRRCSWRTRRSSGSFGR